MLHLGAKTRHYSKAHGLVGRLRFEVLILAYETGFEFELACSVLIEGNRFCCIEVALFTALQKGEKPY